MAELTDREKKIIFIKYIIHGVSPFSELPIDRRVQMLKAAMSTYGLKYEENEMMDLGEAILDLQKNMGEAQGGFLEKNKGLVNEVLGRMNKGNDRFKI